MKLTLGFTTCPNDTFVFDALIHGKTDTEGLEFDVIMTDVEELNRMAFSRTLQVTKLSYHAYAFVAGNYKLLNSGSAMGRENGPLLIGRFPGALLLSDQARVAIPGNFTTANFLFSIFFPQFKNKTAYLFSEIEGVLLKGEADAGVIIHENRFTYEKRGLVKLADLGEMWTSQAGLPIPLGCIVADRDLPDEIIAKVDRVLKRSITFALEHPESPAAFVKKHAREMDDHIIRQHIGLYVNNFTVNIGEVGKEAVRRFFTEGFEAGIIPLTPDDL